MVRTTDEQADSLRTALSIHVEVCAREKESAHTVVMKDANSAAGAQVRRHAKPHTHTRTHASHAQPPAHTFTRHTHTYTREEDK